MSPTSGDAIDLASAIKAGKLTCSDAMRKTLAACRENENLGAIAYFDAETGVALARSFDQEASQHRALFESRPFVGVPTLAKDLGGPFAGLPVAAGSKLFNRKATSPDSDLAKRFRDAGLCPFGLSTTPEFGLSLSSEPAIGPISRNPLALELTSGGSSGGAAAAVAGGLVAIAHATDAGGSIRVPAACCGLVGLKPTRGAVPAGPSFGNHLGGIASELAVTRSVRDTAQIFKAVRGETRGPFADIADRPGRTDPLRIGLLTDTGGQFPTNSERLQAVESAASCLEKRGRRLVPLPWSAFAEAVSLSGRAFADIISVNLARIGDELNLDFSTAEKLTRAFLSRGLAVQGTKLWRSLEGAVLTSRRLWDVFESVDVIVTPMLTSAPPPIGSFPTDHSDTDEHLNRMSAFAPLASLANISGFPAITLPFGADSDGLPLPVQILAPMGADALLLSLASQLEAEGRWRHRHPIAALVE